MRYFGGIKINCGPLSLIKDANFVRNVRLLKNIENLVGFLADVNETFIMTNIQKYILYLSQEFYNFLVRPVAGTVNCSFKTKVKKVEIVHLT